MPAEDGWGGWLGRYQAALAEATINIIQRSDDVLIRQRKRQRDRPFGR